MPSRCNYILAPAETTFSDATLTYLDYSKSILRLMPRIKKKNKGSPNHKEKVQNTFNNSTTSFFKGQQLCYTWMLKWASIQQLRLLNSTSPRSFCTSDAGHIYASKLEDEVVGCQPCNAPSSGHVEVGFPKTKLQFWGGTYLMGVRFLCLIVLIQIAKKMSMSAHIVVKW